MTGHKDILSSFQEIKGGDISFGDKTTGGIIGQGSVELNSKIKNTENEVILKGRRANSTHNFDRSYLPERPLCLAAVKDHTNLWHQRLGHASLHLLHKLSTKALIKDQFVNL